MNLLEIFLCAEGTFFTVSKKDSNINDKEHRIINNKEST